MSTSTAQAIERSLQSPNESDSNGEAANVVDGLFYLGRSIRAAAHDLGTGDAGTRMGAIEFLASTIKEASERIAAALGEVAAAINHVAEDG